MKGRNYDFQQTNPDIRRGRCIAPSADVSALGACSDTLMKQSKSIIAHILLDVNGVTFGYDRVPLLYDVQLHVRTGEMVGLLWPN